MLYAQLMAAKLTSLAPLIFCLSFAAALFGQIDSYQLRAKYGPPLDRETFTISPGYQIVVDYRPDRQVSRLELPPDAPSLDQPGVITAKRVEDILLELVPASMREDVIISEPQDPAVPGRRTAVTVIFKSSGTALFGQIDTYHLRAKYGPPLARETFTLPPGYQIIVDYGPDQQACRLEVPADRKEADDVLLELVPMAMRGKQLQSWLTISGAHSAISTVHYERVVISKSGDASNGGPRADVTFKREVCRGL
jgi:hypothetical protein